jgi:hypothetical protein
MRSGSCAVAGLPEFQIIDSAKSAVQSNEPRNLAGMDDERKE